MSCWLWLASLALAQPPTPPPAALELTGMARGPDDVEVFVRYDGSLMYQGELAMSDDLEDALHAAIEASPEARVVVTGDTQAPYDALIGAVVLARAAGAKRTAIEVLSPDLMLEDLWSEPLFPGDGAQPEVIEKPKRHRLPQNPYANTNSYTAYALEWGETKVGFGAVSTGVAPRLQIGTVPVLYAAGVLSANAKLDLLRKGPLDAALGIQYYHVPLTGLASRALGSGEDVSVGASYLGVGGTGSLRLLDPWTAHLQLYWARPAIRGEIGFDSLPEVLLPGQSLGGTAEVGLGVNGDLGILNLATDLRFNRRDSLYAWLRYPFYGRVRGRTSGEIGGFENLSNADFIVAYGDWIPPGDSASLAVGYQASYKHLEARVGIGWSAVPGAWLLQAFELSYRFGGATRRQERRIRKHYRQSLPAAAPPAE